MNRLAQAWWKARARRATGRELGLTYMETLMVAAVVLVLAGAAVPMARWGARRTKESKLRRNLSTIREAIDRYHQDAVLGVIDVNRIEDRGITSLSGPPPAQYYPPDLEVLLDGVPLLGQSELPDQETQKKVYLRRIPQDPFQDEEEECDQFGWGLIAYQDDPDMGSWGGENVWDVRSCSELPALDGETHYREW